MCTNICRANKRVKDYLWKTFYYKPLMYQILRLLLQCNWKVRVVPVAELISLWLRTHHRDKGRFHDYHSSWWHFPNPICIKPFRIATFLRCTIVSHFSDSEFSHTIHFISMIVAALRLSVATSRVNDAPTWGMCPRVSWLVVFVWRQLQKRGKNLLWPQLNVSQGRVVVSGFGGRHRRSEKYLMCFDRSNFKWGDS